MQLTYKNLLIRNATVQDAQLLCQWWNDGQVMAHAGFPNGLNTSAEAVARSLAADSDGTGRRLIIQVGDAPVGEMNYQNKGGGRAEIGIKICRPAMQEKGHGTIFLKMLITGLFAEGYDEIILDTNLKNTRAQHVYEKLGFEKMRVNHDCWQDQLGCMQSSVDYRLLKEQFCPLEVEM